IPATDTPGAKDTLVHEFIIKMIKDCTGKKTQNNFIDGLKDLRAYCGNNYRVSYEDLNPGQQEEVMEHYENKAKSFNGLVAKAQNMFLGKPFFHILKEYTVEGYCTSQKGATLGLNYLAVPGRFNGCTTLEPGQKAWATN
ncbi:MAG: gluconate 2-dehydrogenase subunit 3 family protein, partial [Chitinophagaceae bacterium]|nr:gluconate 2-dehydrogenase subunit 3 family protein [Chitinophagaceae bacterium]